MLSGPKGPAEEQQGAIYEYVVRNCREIREEIENKMMEAQPA